MTVKKKDGTPGGVRPIRENLLLNVGEPLDQVRLAGTRCAACGETSLGTVAHCPNCGSNQVTGLPLSPRGSVWSYTVARHQPPGNYRGPEPFQPFGIGLVELPEGLRVMTRIDGDVDSLRVGLPVEFNPSLRHDADGSLVVTFSFTPAAGAAS